MGSKALIGLSICLSFLAFGKVIQLYAWPRLRTMHRDEALTVLVAPHMFRFVGLGFLMPGVVSPALSPAFAYPAAYGDLAAAVLALVATFALSARASWAIAIVWLLNLEGTADLLFANYQGLIGVGLAPGVLGAAVFIPTLIVPPLLIAHALMFWLLMRSESGR